MQTAPIPRDEEQRLEAVHRVAILDTKPEERFDMLTRKAVKELKVPISTVSILDSNREWFKSCVGSVQKEGDRSISFCGHALLATNIFIVEDTLKDERFADNPMVVGTPFIRFYAGQALLDRKTGQPIGVFCVNEVGVFMDIANQVEKELNK